MENYYYIHSESGDWTDKELDDIQDFFKKNGIKNSRKAAIGEGAGGSGLGKIIEFIFDISNIAGLVDVIWRIVTFIKSRKSQRSAIRLVIHANNNIIGLDTNENISDIKIAIKDKLKIHLKNTNGARLELHKNKWLKY